MANQLLNLLENHATIEAKVNKSTVQTKYF